MKCLYSTDLEEHQYEESLSHVLTRLLMKPDRPQIAKIYRNLTFAGRPAKTEIATVTSSGSVTVAAAVAPEEIEAMEKAFHSYREFERFNARTKFAGIKFFDKRKERWYERQRSRCVFCN